MIPFHSGDVAAAFLERLRDAPGRALLVDFDGTLAPFAADRRRARPYPEAREALERIAAAGRTRLGIVSGRPVADLPALLEMEPLPELWGSHGLEHRISGGSSEAAATDPKTLAALGVARAALEREGFGPLLEPKPFGVALHSRADPGRFPAAREALRRFERDLVAAGLEPLEFDGGLEFRPAGRNKGQVVEAVLQEMPRGSVVAFLGDDRTDEDAFRSIAGRGLGVLVRAEWHPTAAGAWLRPPAGLTAFLDAWERAAQPARFSREAAR